MGFRIWISYDLGIDGNYNRLYQVLDEVGAKECGDSLATVLLDAKSQFEPLLKRLKTSIRPRASDRLYVIFPKDDGGVTGKFIHGSRKRAPWTGYAVGSEEETSDES